MLFEKLHESPKFFQKPWPDCKLGQDVQQHVAEDVVTATDSNRVWKQARSHVDGWHAWLEVGAQFVKKLWYYVGHALGFCFGPKISAYALN